MEKIEAGFTNSEIQNLNLFQKSSIMHPFTCSGHNIAECERSSGVSEGVLIATADGWVCPCGKYTQNWAHKFMSEKPKKYLFLDDISPVKEAYLHTHLDIFIEKQWDIVRSYNQFTEYITKNGLPEFISFDHDLGDTHYCEEKEIYVEKSGYDCALWLVNYCQEYKLKSPDFYCHSMNSVGKHRINSLLYSFSKNN